MSTGLPKQPKSGLKRRHRASLAWHKSCVVRMQLFGLSPHAYDGSLAMSRNNRCLLSAAGCLLIAPCAPHPATGKREISLMSEAQEVQLGREADIEVQREMGLYDDSRLQNYVNDIGQRLARDSHRPNLPWHFAVVDAAAVNAFALPGGYIYLTR